MGDEVDESASAPCARQRVSGKCTVNFEATDLGFLSVLINDPDFFEHFVELFVIIQAEDLLRRNRP